MTTKVDTDEARTHINFLRANGYTMREIAGAAKVTNSALSNIAYRATRTSHATVQAVLAVKPQPVLPQRFGARERQVAAELSRQPELTYIDDSWYDHAACAGHPVSLWFPEKNETEYHPDGVALCESCPTKARCLFVAVERGEQAGLWANTNPGERSRIRKDDAARFRVRIAAEVEAIEATK